MTPKSLTLVVAINPTASFGKGRKVGPAVVQTLRALGHTVTSLTEPDFDQLMDAARIAIARKPDAFIVVGGDGMVSLAANLLVGTTVPLGIVPSGTGNDMARGLGIPYDNAEAAIEALVVALARPARRIDAGRVEYTDDETGRRAVRWFAGVLSAGFDSVVTERANTMQRPKGPNRYLVALALELLRLKPIDYRLVLDGTEVVTKAMLVSVGNNVSIGGGMKVTPQAVIDDGLLDILVVRPLSRLAFLRIFPRVFKGTHVNDARVTIHRATRVSIESSKAVAYADGERISSLPVNIEIVPRALRILGI
jgi:diacylglycerol kinase (ATP)